MAIRTRLKDSEASGERSPRDVELLELKGAFRGVFRTLSRLRGRDTHLGASELSHAQFELLAELAERGGLPAGELAIAAELSPGTVTQMLDHLAECGHVERVRSDSDRRVVISRLTPQGRRKLTAKRDAWKGRWEQALSEFDVEELRIARRVLARVGAMLAEPPAEARSAGAQTLRSEVQERAQK